MQVISQACLDLDGLHFQVLDPLNFMAYVKLPFDLRRIWILGYS